MKGYTKAQKIERLKKLMNGEISLSELRPRFDSIIIGGKTIEFENSITDQCLIINGKVIYF